MDDKNEITPLAERGHGRGVDKRRPTKKAAAGTWKTRLDGDTIDRLRAIRDGFK